MRAAALVGFCLVASPLTAADDRPGDEVGKGTLLNWIHLRKYYLEDEKDLKDLIGIFPK